MRDQAAGLRTMLRQPNGGRAQVIAVASGKGGVGKTTVAVNLGLAMQELGLQVSLVDADLGLANADLLLGLVPRYTLSDVHRGLCGVEEVIMTDVSGMRLLPGASGAGDLHHLAGGELDAVIKALRFLEEHSDIVIYDTGAGIGERVMAFIAVADAFLLVTTPEPTALTDAYALLKEAWRTRDVPCQLIVNRVRGTPEGEAVAAGLESTVQRFLHRPLPLLGCLAEDPLAARAVRDGVPLWRQMPSGPLGRQLQGMAASLAGHPQTEQPVRAWHRLYRGLSISTLIRGSGR